MLQIVLSEKDEKVLYYVVLASTLVSLLLYVLARRFFGFTLVGGVPNCIFKQLTGLYCPGCGGTHALEAFLHGRFLESFLYHPLVLYAGVLLTLFLATHTLKYLTGGRFKIVFRFREIYLYGVLALLLINWIVRNVLLLACGITIY